MNVLLPILFIIAGSWLLYWLVTDKDAEGTDATFGSDHQSDMESW